MLLFFKKDSCWSARYLPIMSENATDASHKQDFRNIIDRSAAKSSPLLDMTGEDGTALLSFADNDSQLVWELLDTRREWQTGNRTLASFASDISRSGGAMLTLTYREYLTDWVAEFQNRTSHLAEQVRQIMTGSSTEFRSGLLDARQHHLRQATIGKLRSLPMASLLKLGISMSIIFESIMRTAHQSREQAILCMPVCHVGFETLT